jgi:SAM-dependent methyltransferase
VHAGKLVELLPAKPSGVTLSNSAGHYNADYLHEFSRPLVLNESAIAWGAPESNSAPWIGRRRRQVEAVLRLLSKKTDACTEPLCDFSGGAGRYTFACAAQSRTVIHCDLSVDALSYCVSQAAKLGIDNIFFIRMDYFRPPFRKTLKRVICMDTLIRGQAHEKLLLESIRSSLGNGGVALVDFHNWWHNPLRRLGILRQNFGKNRSYSRNEAERLLKETGIHEFRYTPFHQEAPQFPPPALLDLVLPPTRLMYRFGEGQSRCASL